MGKEKRQMSDNKYLDYINDREDPDDDRRKARRKKRIRSRLGAWIALVLVLGLIAVAVTFGIKAVSKGKLNLDFAGLFHASVEEPETSDDASDVVDSLLGEEADVVIAPPEPVSEEPTYEDNYNQWLEEQISALPLEEKVLGLFIVRPEQITGVDTVVQAGDGTKEALGKYPVGGIVYSDKNIISDEQFKTMISNTRSFSKYPVFLMLNEEPGNTILANKLGLADTKSAAEIGATSDPHEAYVENKTVSDYLKEYGIDFNIGICADLLKPGEKDSVLFMADRSYGSDSGLVSRMVYEAVSAYRENGIFTGVGYFPGQGDLTSDPGSTVSESGISYEVFMGTDAELFKSAIESGASAIVVGHTYNSELTGDPVPASVSKRIYTDIIRSEMGLRDTILITDALDKPVISEYYTSEEVCVKALKAGADMLMCPEDFEAGFNAVMEAVKGNVISEERINDALKRVWRIKYADIYAAEHPEDASED